MPGIFISHSSKDKVLAHSLAEKLKARGYACFLDFKSIPGGVEWEKEIYTAMHQSTVMLLCATAEAMESKWVFAEIVMARYSGITLIPLIMKECILPENISSTVQHIDFTRDPGAGYERLWEALKRAEVTPSVAQWPRNESPYPGLLAFTDKYARVFFGRDHELESAFNHLRQGAQQKRFLAIIGPSGCGKSSFARAGIFPGLKRGVIPGSEDWTYLTPFVPGESPFLNLAQSAHEADIENRLGRIRDIERNLRKADGIRYELLNLRRGDGRIVLLIDQLEEIERRTPRSVATEFIIRLHEGLDAPDSPLTVLATLRADFVRDCLQFPDLAQLLQSGTQLLGSMNRQAMRQAIQRPAESTNFVFDTGLVEEILDEAVGGDALPLLAHILADLWEKAQTYPDHKIRRQDYVASGGVTGALSIHAQKIYDETPEDERTILLQALIELADVNERGEFTRRRTAMASLPSLSQKPLERFVSARLLIASGDGENRNIEVAHEALLRNWVTLRTKLDEKSNMLRLRGEIERAALDWDIHGRPDSYLWDYERIEAATKLVKDESWLSGDLIANFLTSSHKRNQQRLSRESELLANRILRDYQEDPERGILLALATNEEYTFTPRLELALNTSLFVRHGVRNFYHEDEVNSAVFSPDGTRILTASWDRIARIWDISTGENLSQLRGHDSTVNSAVFSLDGKRIVTTSDDFTARIWNAHTGLEVFSLTGHTDMVLSAAFSRDGKHIVTGSADETARVWDARSGRALFTLRGHNGAVFSTSFNPNGTSIVTASEDYTSRIWDKRAGQQLVLLEGHTEQVLSAAFSPDGRRIVTGSDDRTVRVWDSDTGRELLLLRGHIGSVLRATFSPDGTRIVTLSRDETIRLWDGTSGQELFRIHDIDGSHIDFSPDGNRVVIASSDHTAQIWYLSGSDELIRFHEHYLAVNSVSFSPNGKHILTASDDRTARIWHSHNGRELLRLQGHRGSVLAAAFSPDGRYIATASADNTARTWDTQDEDQELAHLKGHRGPIYSIAFSPDGIHIITASRDKTSRIWDSYNGQEILVIPGHHDAVLSAVFSPDQKYILTASADNTARVWNSYDGQEVLVIHGHDGAVLSAVFSPDGKHILTASTDRTARIWDAKTGVKRLQLTGHEDAVNSAAFNPDGRLIVTGSSDRTARIWSTESGQELHRLRGHNSDVNDAAFSPNGTQVVTASTDRTARVWRHLQFDELVVLAHGVVTRQLSIAERKEYGLRDKF